MCLLPFRTEFWQTIARGSILTAFLREVPVLSPLHPAVTLCAAVFEVRRFCVQAFLYLCVFMDNRSFERAEELKYLEITLTNQNCIPEEITSTLNLENVCYHSV